MPSSTAESAVYAPVSNTAPKSAREEVLCRIVLGLLLVAYIVYFFAAGSTILLWTDELLSFYTGQIGTIHDLIHVQIASPISLDPPLYHLLSHLALALPVKPDLAIRMPAGLGFLVMLLAVFAVMKRLEGASAGVLAIAVFLASPLLYYATEARPYGLLLGASASALYFWMSAIYAPSKRAQALLGLFLSLAVALNCHYYGILALLPFFAAESYRSLARNRLDWPVAGAITAAALSVTGWLPFLKGAGQYKEHYYNKFHFSQGLSAYEALLAFLQQGHRGALLSGLFILAFVIWGGLRTLQTEVIPQREQSFVWIALYAFSLLPVAGLVLARLSGGALEARFVLEAGIGLFVIAIAAIAGGLRSRIGLIVIVIVIGGLLVSKAVQFEQREQQSKRDLADFAELEHYQGGPILISDLGGLMGLEHYAGPGFAANFAGIHDQSAELRYTQSEVLSRTSIALSQFTSLPLSSYPAFAAAHPRHLLLCWQAFPCWLPDYLRSQGAGLAMIQRDRKGTIYSVVTQGALQAAQSH